jgi:hypothetical protein
MLADQVSNEPTRTRNADELHQVREGGVLRTWSPDRLLHRHKAAVEDASTRDSRHVGNQPGTEPRERFEALFKKRP